MANKVIESPKYLSLVNKQISYISKYDLALSSTLTYNRIFMISLVYKYKANSIEFKNQRKLIKVS
jgi:hypothetical protein